MCLSVPGKIVTIEDDIATVDYDGETRVASTALIPDVKVGNYVLINAKMIMQIVPEEEAKKTLKLWDQIDKKTTTNDEEQAERIDDNE